MQSWHCRREVRGQKIEGKKGVKSAAATSQGSSVPEPWHETQSCDSSAALASVGHRSSGALCSCVTSFLLWLQSMPCYVCKGSGQSRAVRCIGNICISLCCSCTFFCHVGPFLQYVDGIRCIKHGVNVCKEHAFLPGICISRLSGLAMSSWRTCKKKYRRSEENSGFFLSPTCIVLFHYLLLLLNPQGKVVRKICLYVFIHRHREKKCLQD